ncbi:hypothetical protein CXG81DRAFT_24955 [Caulochytrium protostelioides]|uniref:DUF4042 domain-containing protein n=1 Tax=Caulochytrium protostelioides TaxID=1555241 RepID=A0A4P9XBE0_9FUNG|nr:hypothetical protein CXG81DRAFT_24955 [Caulochytrium protostelioides]|eukprot:RKP02411.1 hypothetical protein CXG81DRAFT_24955 [Caulochytrium protostelioides]
MMLSPAAQAALCRMLSASSGSASGSASASAAVPVDGPVDAPVDVAEALEQLSTAVRYPSAAIDARDALAVLESASICGGADPSKGTPPADRRETETHRRRGARALHQWIYTLFRQHQVDLWPARDAALITTAAVHSLLGMLEAPPSPSPSPSPLSSSSATTPLPTRRAAAMDLPPRGSEASRPHTAATATAAAAAVPATPLAAPERPSSPPVPAARVLKSLATVVYERGALLSPAARQRLLATLRPIAQGVLPTAATERQLDAAAAAAADGGHRLNDRDEGQRAAIAALGNACVHVASPTFTADVVRLLVGVLTADDRLPPDVPRRARLLVAVCQSLLLCLNECRSAVTPHLTTLLQHVRGPALGALRAGSAPGGGTSGCESPAPSTAGSMASMGAAASAAAAHGTGSARWSESDGSEWTDRGRRGSALLSHGAASGARGSHGRLQSVALTLATQLVRAHGKAVYAAWSSWVVAPSAPPRRGLSLMTLLHQQLQRVRPGQPLHVPSPLELTVHPCLQAWLDAAAVFLAVAVPKAPADARRAAFTPLSQRVGDDLLSLHDVLLRLVSQWVPSTSAAATTSAPRAHPADGHDAGVDGADGDDGDDGASVATRHRGPAVAVTTATLWEAVTAMRLKSLTAFMTATPYARIIAADASRVSRVLLAVSAHAAAVPAPAHVATAAPAPVADAALAALAVLVDALHLPDTAAPALTVAQQRLRTEVYPAVFRDVLDHAVGLLARPTEAAASVSAAPPAPAGTPARQKACWQLLTALARRAPELVTAPAPWRVLTARLKSLFIEDAADAVSMTEEALLGVRAAALGFLEQTLRSRRDGMSPAVAPEAEQDGEGPTVVAAAAPAAPVSADELAWWQTCFAELVHPILHRSMMPEAAPEAVPRQDGMDGAGSPYLSPEAFAMAADCLATWPGPVLEQLPSRVRQHNVVLALTLLSMLQTASVTAQGHGDGGGADGDDPTPRPASMANAPSSSPKTAAPSAMVVAGAIAACRVCGTYAQLPGFQADGAFLIDVVAHVLPLVCHGGGGGLPLRMRAGWTLGNVCHALVIQQSHAAPAATAPETATEASEATAAATAAAPGPDADPATYAVDAAAWLAPSAPREDGPIVLMPPVPAAAESFPLSGDGLTAALATQVWDAGLHASRDHDKCRANGARIVGSLLRVAPAAFVAAAAARLDMTVQVLCRNVGTGSVKTRWNACYALQAILNVPAVGHLMAAPECPWRGLVWETLLHAIEASTNYKVRIAALSALLAPVSSGAYGTPQQRAQIAGRLEHLLRPSALPVSSAASASSSSAPPPASTATTAYVDVRYIKQFHDLLSRAMRYMTSLLSE